MKFQTISEYVKENKVLLYVIAALFLVIAIGGIYYNRKVHKVETTADIFILKEKLENQKKDSIINKYGKEISRQKAIVTDNQDVINQIASENFNLKNSYQKSLNTIAYWKSITNTKIDSFPVVYHDTIPVRISNKDSAELVAYIRDSTITVPRKASIDTSGLSLTMTISKTKPILDSLRMPDTLNLSVNVKKGGLFKSDTYEFLSSHSNNWITSQKEQSLIYIPKNRGILGYLIAALIGAATIYLTK